MPEQETDLSTILSDLNARVRILESKYNTFGERLLVVNQNMIEEYKHMVSDIRAIDSDVRELQREILRLKESMHDIIKELGFFARKDDVKVLEKYINLWNPLKFVTEKEVERIVEGMLKPKGKRIGDKSGKRKSASNR